MPPVVLMTSCLEPINNLAGDVEVMGHAFFQLPAWSVDNSEAVRRVHHNLRRGGLAKGCLDHACGTGGYRKTVAFSGS